MAFSETLKRRSLALVATVAVALMALFGYQNCAQMNSAGSSVSSKSEASAVKGLPFASSTDRQFAAGTLNGKIANSENLVNPLALVPNVAATQICNSQTTLADRTAEEAKELAAALAAVKAANTNNATAHKLIAVQIAVSFGTATDSIANYANLRAFLRQKTPAEISSGTGNTRYIGIADASKLYPVDVVALKQQYISGQLCYYGVVPVVSNTPVDCNTAFGNNWPMCAMYTVGHGTTLNGTSKDPLGALKGPLETYSYADDANTPMVSFYAADLRRSLYNLPLDIVIESSGFNIVNRGEELKADIKSVFNMVVLNNFRQPLVDALTSTNPVVLTTSTGTLTFYGIDGAGQLLDNMLGQVGSTVAMSTQYTPIVLDLGRPGIKTSSLERGTYFNLAHLKNGAATDPTKAYDVRHKTAWVGGYVNSYLNADGKQILRVEAEDGFLVLPDSQGNISSSAELFSPYTDIDGSGKTYNNGFQALQILAKKDCLSSDIKKKYFGPWDGELFASKVKVWVDKNRNGAAEKSEIFALSDARIGAINPCNVVSQGAKDEYGNSTSLRSTFLYMGQGESIIGNENEIINRIKTGKTSTGATAEFRQAIDVMFNTSPQTFLEPIDLKDVVGIPTH